MLSECFKKEKLVIFQRVVVCVLFPFLAVLWVGLCTVLVDFPGHIHLFLQSKNTCSLPHE